MKATKNARTQFEMLFRRKSRWVVFYLTESNEFDVENVQLDRSKTWSDLGMVLPEHESRFIGFDFEFEENQNGFTRKTDKMYFITWTPEAASPTNHMKYLESRKFIKQMFDGFIDLDVNKVADLKHEFSQIMRYKSDKRSSGDEEGDSDVSDGDDWMDN